MPYLVAYWFFGLFSLIMGLLAPHVSRPAPVNAQGMPRVAINAPVLSTFAAVDGGLGHVAGVSTAVRNFERRSLIGRLFPQLATLPLSGTLGAIPDPELVLRLQPQSVVTWNKLGDGLRATGFPGLIEIQYNSRASLPEIWMTLAKADRRETYASEIMAAAAARRMRLMQSLPKSDPVQRVLPASVIGNSWWFGRRGYFLNSVLEEVGALNPARDISFFGPANIEEILSLDPDAIVIPSGINPLLPSDIYADPQWHVLRAVRAQRVYLMPTGSLFNIAVDDVLWPIWLAELLHPAIPHQIRTAYRQLYARAYHYDLSDEEIDDALFLKENAGSAGYERFARDSNSFAPLMRAPSRTSP